MTTAALPIDLEIPADSIPTVPSARELGAFLHAGARLVVTSHARPDGDAVGSMLAFAGILDQIGVTADLVLADPVPQVYRMLPGVGRIQVLSHIDASRYDGAVVLECDRIERTGLGGGFGALPVLNLDHHQTGTAYGVLNWIDSDTCAVAVLVYRLAQMLQVQVTPQMATCLYTALFTDTGGFTYPGTAFRSLAFASELIALGADADAVANAVLYSLSAAHLRLLGLALSRIQLRQTVAWSYVTQQDLASLGATDEDSEGTVTSLISIAGVDAAIFLRELPGAADQAKRFRVSLRSKGSLDMSAVAAECGGGGHRSAAGCVLQGDLCTTVDGLLTAIERQRAHTVSP